MFAAAGAERARSPEAMLPLMVRLFCQRQIVVVDLVALAAAASSSSALAADRVTATIREVPVVSKARRRRVVQARRRLDAMFFMI